MTATPPINVDVGEKKLYIFSVRQLCILGPTGLLALLILFGPLLSDWTLRFLLAITLVGVGFAITYLPFDGKYFEAWVLEFFAYTGRRRYFVHRAFKPIDHGPKVRMAPAARTSEMPGPKPAKPEPARPVSSDPHPRPIPQKWPLPRRQPVGEGSGVLDPWLLSINLIGLGILVGLATYLYQSGWYQLLLHWAQL